MKIRIMSIILSVAMTFSCLVTITSIGASAADTDDETIYTVSGNTEEIFGAQWSKEITEYNTMTKDGDLYTITFKDVQPQYGPNLLDKIRFKVLAHNSNGRIDEYGDGKSFGMNYYYNSFRVCKACDVTITFDPSTKDINITGDGVRTYDRNTERYYAYSMNCDTFGIDDRNDPYPLSNEMTLGEDGVYYVTFKNVQPQKNILINITAETAETIVGFTGYNYCGIDVTEPCDVTVYFSGRAFDDDSRIWAEGDGVEMKTKPEIGEMHLIGSLSDNSPVESNKMTQTDDYVFTYRADKLTEGINYDFQFYNVQENHKDMWYGVNDDSDFEFGTDKQTAFILSDYAAFFQKDYFSAPFDNASVLITLDLTNFDYVSKQNATYRIDLFGDISTDGNISVTDATELQKSLASITSLTDRQNSIADVNGDGEVNVKDVTAIQEIIVK